MKKCEGKERKGGARVTLCCSISRFAVFGGKRRCPSSFLSAEIQYFGYRVSYGKREAPFFLLLSIHAERKRMTLELFAIESNLAAEK